MPIKPFMKERHEMKFSRLAFGLILASAGVVMSMQFDELRADTKFSGKVYGTNGGAVTSDVDVKLYNSAGTVIGKGTVVAKNYAFNISSSTSAFPWPTGNQTYKAVFTRTGGGTRTLQWLVGEHETSVHVTVP
ncbi:MAG: hypothetical protein K8T89_22315 [Planctomycetes bacterium]|nr:hypothetical protein [Planctomycetota bacterium]